ncbi:MAG: AraC family transcriptional regulator [Cyclobacteriaceae bacterium]
MKIMHEQLSFNSTSSFRIKWDDFPHFTFPWHFHSEYEIVYVIQSFGKRFVGDHISEFDAGDLVLLGSNLPHFWKNDELFHQNNPKYWVNAVVIHFPVDFFKVEINTYPEFFRIKDLLSRAARGISFDLSVTKEIGPKLKDLLHLEGFNRTLSFLSILDEMAVAENYELLASKSFVPNVVDWSGDRLDKVMYLVNASYRQSLRLEDVADQVGMNSSAFSRYFKEKTGKSFSEFIIEMRVSYACKLLTEGKWSITQVCYESGFNNLSNFNRQFRKITAYTPTQFQDQYHRANVV